MKVYGMDVPEAVRVKKRWAEVKGAFKNVDSEYARMALKSLCLEGVNVHWESGVINVARVELFRRAFPDDKYFGLIFDGLNERVNEYVNGYCGGDLGRFTELLFRNQPVCYVGDNVESIFDVEGNNWYKNKFRKKYPEAVGVLEDCFV